MSMKQLKAAKKALEGDDPELALEHVDEVLLEEPNNYYAHIFRGKSYQLLNKLDKASASFAKATSIEPDTLLGWKGYFQVVRSQDDYAQFFQVLTSYLKVLIHQGIGIGDVIKEVYNYLNAHKYHSDAELSEMFLLSILPGTELGDLLDGAMGKPEEILQQLITLVRDKEAQELRTKLAKEKLRLPRVLNPQHKAHLNEIEWSIRQQYNLSELYKKFLHFSNDDELRRKYEQEFLKYRYELLRVVPEKKTLLQEIKEMCTDMVVIDTNDMFAWSLYFDLQDPKSLADLDEGIVFRFIRKFQKEGLGVLLLAFVMSDMCPFDKARIAAFKAEINEAKLKNPSFKEGDGELKNLEEDEAVTENSLTPSEILDMMVEGYSKCSNSTLADRVICNFYIHLNEYEAGSSKCTTAIHHLAELQRTYGIDLANAKQDILCLLATVYTYYEAPKNFSRALQLYDRILKDSPNNKQALIGKGLILLEKRDLELAKEILSQVAKSYPKDVRALKELGWCHILMKNFNEGREVLEKALVYIEGASVHQMEMRATIRARIAKSYLLEGSPSEENLKIAFDNLIQSLKDHPTYAPSYTLLGTLYKEYYHNEARAQKCFYKAFELDVSEIEAAKYLASDFAEKQEWDITEVICQRVVTSEKSRRILFSQLYDDSDKSWPYRVLGCSALNKQDDAKAIEWFQTALRMKAMDPECWTGLGEAYYNCGRIDAAIKVFKHTTTIVPDSWTNFYMLGLSVCAIGDFSDGLALLKKALAMSPDEECILNAIYEQSINHSAQLLQGGFTKRMLETNIETIDTISRAVKINSTSQNLWKSLCDCLNLATSVQQEIQKFPIATVILIVNQVPNIDDDMISSKRALDLFENNMWVNAICSLAILSARAAIAVLPKKVNKLLRASCQFNLGRAFLVNAQHDSERKEQCQEAAIIAIKSAIQLEPGNAQYWIALANAYTSTKPQIAQHCFIKASTLDARDVSVWTNLAAFYLRYGDVELAREAFDKATSLAPDQATSWLGNALAADLSNDMETASRLTTHAYILSKGRSPLSQLYYAVSIVNKRVGHAKDVRDVEAAQEFSIANFAIQNFLKFHPDDVEGLKLCLLLSERCQTYKISVEVGETLCRLLEEKYERTEDIDTLIEFAEAKTLLARVYLGMEDYEKAVDCAQFTMDCLAEEELTKEITQSLLSSRIVIGLAFFFNGQFKEALEEFQIILAEHNLSQRVVTLIAQVLHARNTTETKQAALDELFAFIEEYGSSLIVVLTLGAISIVDNLKEYFTPIKEELESLKPTDLVDDTSRLVPTMLQELSFKTNNDTRVWQKFAMLFPGDFNIWKNLDASMALSTAMLTDTKCTAREVSDAYLQKGTRREVQRALLICGDNHEAHAALLSKYN